MTPLFFSPSLVVSVPFDYICSGVERPFSPSSYENLQQGEILGDREEREGIEGRVECTEGREVINSNLRVSSRFMTELRKYGLII